MSEWLSLGSKIRDIYIFWQNPGRFAVCRVTFTTTLYIKVIEMLSSVQKDCKDLEWETVHAKNSRQTRCPDHKTPGSALLPPMRQLLPPCGRTCPPSPPQSFWSTCRPLPPPLLCLPSIPGLAPPTLTSLQACRGRASVATILYPRT